MSMMSDAPPPAKRRRANSHSRSDDHSPTRCRTLWMPHGDIILQAESTQFRVHRDLLARHSSVFDGMFMLPTPQDEPTLEGCPVVILATDSAKDWELLLKALYDPFKHGDLWPIDDVAAMLRLGTKYEMASVQKNAFSRFHQFPTTFDEWNELGDDVFAFRKQPGLRLSLLNLACECKVRTAIPALSLICLDWFSLESILDDSAARQYRVSPSIKMMLALAVDRINTSQSRILLSYATPPACADQDTCAKEWHWILTFLLETVQARGFLYWVQGEWDPSWSDGFCDQCDETIQKKFREDLEKLWEDLPSFLGLPAWSELRNFD
ncbi:hypothetical protein C8F01DRAFT_1141150 [Mycena amicta]|nr:hypothetical protein C8F01DRAFT_1141150 [Mycena amicta]